MVAGEFADRIRIRGNENQVHLQVLRLGCKVILNASAERSNRILSLICSSSRFLHENDKRTHNDNQDSVWWPGNESSIYKHTNYYLSKHIKM
jgi:hypothetical protein